MYTIKKLADIANISTRTLRYYDEIGLLSPTSLSESGYRLYDKDTIELLQHILFYKTLGMPLCDIKKVMYDADFDSKVALLEHREALLLEGRRIETLIKTVNKSLQAMEGQYNMTETEKFEGFKDNLIKKNEELFGQEIKEKFGNTVNASYKKIKAMDQETMDNLETFTNEMNIKFKEALLEGDASSKKALEACAMHEKWIKHYWDFYTKEAHLGLVNMYVEDERFTAYYDKVEKGLAYFIKEAMTIYLN